LAEQAVLVRFLERFVTHAESEEVVDLRIAIRVLKNSILLKGGYIFMATLTSNLSAVCGTSQPLPYLPDSLWRAIAGTAYLSP